MQLSFCTGLFRAVPDYTLYYIPETARDNRKWRVAVASHDYNGNDAKMTKMATIKLGVLAESYSGPQAS